MLLLLLALAQATTPESYVISGTVVEHLSNRPLHHVLVTIAAVDQPKIHFSFVTADDGRFDFKNVLPGKYSLSAQKRGGQQQFYRQDEQFWTGIATGPGLSSENIVFTLETPASLSGTVLDGDGDPVRQANIWLFRKGVVLGRMHTDPAGSTQTDPSGTFQFGRLGRGSYLVAVQAQPWYAQHQPSQPSAGGPAAVDPALDVAYPITYYGDSTDAASASPITLVEGGSASVQITVRAVPAVHVSLSGNWRQVNNTVLAEGPGGFPLPQGGTVAVGSDHQELIGIAPGHYLLQTQNFGQNGQVERVKTAKVDLTGQSSVNLKDVQETSVSGQLHFEGLERHDGNAYLRFSCGDQDFVVFVAKDGTFNTGHVSPRAHCEVILFNVPGFYVKSVAVKGVKPSADSIEIAEGSQLELSVTAGQGGLSQLPGVAVKDGQPFAGAMVLLLPEDMSRSALIARDQSDSDGTFTLNGIRPGRYTLVAIDDGRDLAYQDPLVMKAYLDEGKILEFPLRSDASVRVKVLSRRF